MILFSHISSILLREFRTEYSRFRHSSYGCSGNDFLPMKLVEFRMPHCLRKRTPLWFSLSTRDEEYVIYTRGQRVKLAICVRYSVFQAHCVHNKYLTMTKMPSVTQVSNMINEWEMRASVC